MYIEIKLIDKFNTDAKSNIPGVWWLILGVRLGIR
jgi:hypothetical protein